MVDQQSSDQQALANLLDAVEGVLQYTWDNNDEDAAEAIDRLRTANEDLGVVQRLGATPATPSSNTVSAQRAVRDNPASAVDIMHKQQAEIERLRADAQALHDAEHALAMIAAVTPEDTDVGRYARNYFRRQSKSPELPAVETFGESNGD